MPLFSFSGHGFSGAHVRRRICIADKFMLYEHVRCACVCFGRRITLGTPGGQTRTRRRPHAVVCLGIAAGAGRGFAVDMLWCALSSGLISSKYMRMRCSESFSLSLALWLCLYENEMIWVERSVFRIN